MLYQSHLTLIFFIPATQKVTLAIRTVPQLIFNKWKKGERVNNSAFIMHL